MIPDSNNVYGTLTALRGLQPVSNAINAAVAGCRASIYRSQFNGAETLHVRSESAEFDSDPLKDGAKHPFNGAVGGTPKEVADFVQTLSDALSVAGVEHSFEIHDSEQKVVKVVQRQ